MEYILNLNFISHASNRLGLRKICESNGFRCRFVFILFDKKWV